MYMVRHLYVECDNVFISLFPFFFIIVFYLLYFSNAAAKPFLLYLKVFFSPILSACFKLAVLIFTKAFHLPPVVPGVYSLLKRQTKQASHQMNDAMLVYNTTTLLFISFCLIHSNKSFFSP